MPNFNRRGFVKFCGSMVALVKTNPQVLASPDRLQTSKKYNRTTLVDKYDFPLRIEDIEVGETYLFYYPYISTPCFLINLGHPVNQHHTLQTSYGNSYRWEGGVGPQNSIVAFSAICAHKMSHPARSISFINYRHEPVNFVDNSLSKSRQQQVIYCCSEKSVYDPTNGAKVLGGPAPQPLAAITLDYDKKQKTFSALGTHGGEMFEQYFKKFAFRLSIEFRTDEIQRQVTHNTKVVRLKDYCQSQVLC